VFVAVEVVYALPDRQFVARVHVPAGATVSEAIRASGVLRAYPELTRSPLDSGVNGVPVPLDWPVTEGDRVELYRPLTADPKETRRRRARKASR
jgi:putative ubiquitin-RnfH superfamily antitoxin RatB of RatAB toxin-antitoxin module